MSLFERFEELNAVSSEITVTSQREMNEVSTNYTGKIIINSDEHIIIRKKYSVAIIVINNSRISVLTNTKVELRDNAYAEAREGAVVHACGNSYVEAFNNCEIYAYDNAFIVGHDSVEIYACGNTLTQITGRVKAYARGTSKVYAEGHSECFGHDKSLIYATGNASVTAYDNSIVQARGYAFITTLSTQPVMAEGFATVDIRGTSSAILRQNTSGILWDNASVEAYDNSQVFNHSVLSVPILRGNSRLIDVVATVSNFIDFYHIERRGDKAIFYKAVRKKDDGTYYSDYDTNFTYTIGETITEVCDTDVNEICSHGIHIAHLDWAIAFGFNWTNLAILEFEVDIDKIVVPIGTNGKVRTSEVKVLREVPLEECGFFGEMVIRKNKAKGIE